MADVKNFGLIGVGSSLQFSKGGAKLVNNAGTFNFKAANGTTDSAATASALTATTGDLAATLGNLTLSATGATISVGSDTTLSRQQAGVFQFAGTAAVMLPAGTTGQEPSASAFGMIRSNIDNAAVEYFDGTVWRTVANTYALGTLQTEVDSIETSLGGMVNADGTYNSAGLVNASIWTTPTTDLTSALNTLAAKVMTDNSLDEIFPSLASGNVIYSDATTNQWVQAAPGATSGVQSWSSSLDNLAAKSTTGVMVQTGVDTYQSASFAATGGLTASDLSTTTGVISFGTTGNLAQLNAFSGTGLVSRAADGTLVGTTIASTNANLVVTNGAGIAGAPTLSLAGNLAQVSGLTTVGFLVRHTDGTTSTESITGTTGRIDVANGTGDTSSVTVDLAAVTQGTTGSFVKVALDGFGRVTGNAAVVTADITALVDSQYIRQDGTSSGMTGSLNLGNQTITNVATPVNSTDAANKAYVDNAVSGLTWKDAVVVKASANISIAAPGAVIDGVTLATGDRILVTGQTTTAENGIYVFNGAAVPLTRSADAATPALLTGAAVFVESGTVANSGWVQTVDPLASFATQSWTQFSGAGAYAGSGAVTVAGTTIGLTVGNGLTQTTELALNIDAASALNDTAGPLTLALQSTGGLNQSGSQLGISAAGVTNAMLANSTFILDGDTGTGTATLGGTLDVKGTSGQGIITSVSGSSYTITASDASSTQKGVATFNAASFTTTAGDVTIKAGGVTNTQLVNSTFLVTGDTGSDTVTLGDTATFKISGDTMISTVASATGVALKLNTVDVAHGGTGQVALTANQVIYGNGTSPVAQSANFTFDGTSTLTVGGAKPLAINGETGSITATATNSDVVLMPNGTGSVIVGPVGAGLIQSDSATALTIKGNLGLTLSGGSTTGAGQYGISVVIPAGTSAATKVSVSGPTATDYATNLGANDLTNKQYVDQAIASGASAGAIKAFQVVVPLNANGTTNIPMPTGVMPAGATVLSVKVNVTTVDTGATLSVGKSGAVAAYMAATENDAQTQGLYVAECFVTESAATQLTATVAASSGSGAGSAVVIVQYQVAQ